MEKNNIDDSVPTEDEVEAAVKNMRRNRARGPSGIRAESIKGWLAAARRGGKAAEKGKEKTAAEEEGEEMWAKVVKLTQMAFREGKLAEEATWQAVAMVPKGKGGVLGYWAGGRCVETPKPNPPSPLSGDTTA